MEHFPIDFSKNSKFSPWPLRKASCFERATRGPIAKVSKSFLGHIKYTQIKSLAEGYNQGVLRDGVPTGNNEFKQLSVL